MADYPDSLDSEDFPVSNRGTVCAINGKDITVKMMRYNVRSAPEELIASRAASGFYNRKAADRVANMPVGFCTNDRAVYIVTPESGTASKLGIAKSPLNRLAQLQTSHYEQLHIEHLFWLPEKQAQGLETLALRVVSKMGVRLTGEWCDLDAHDLACVIATVIKSNQAIHVADSEMHYRNIKRLLSLDEEAHHSRAYSFGVNPERLLQLRA